jgi:O-antigen ligase
LNTFFSKWNVAEVDMTACESSRFKQPVRLKSTQHAGLYVFLLLMLAWAPIPIGSNRVWSLALLEAGALFTVGAWMLSYTRQPFEIPPGIYRVRYSLYVLALWLVYPLLQLIPVPTSTLGIVGDGVGMLYVDLPPNIPTDTAYLTLDRGATFAGFIRQCSVIAVLYSVLALTTSESRLRGLLTLILVVGFLEALYGLLLYFGGDELGLWNPGHAQATVSGTYVNQNHFAGLLEIAIPVGLGLLLSLWPRREERPEKNSFLRSLLGFLLSQRAMILFCVLIMTAALIMTASRGGIGAVAAGVIVAVSIAVWKKGVRARELTVGVVAVALAATAIFWFGSGKFPEKLQTAGFASDRGALREISYSMIGDNPLFGTGLGTYRWVFPNYKDERFGSYFYEHTHNDFLETFSEQGVIGFSLLAVGLLLIFVPIVRAYGKRSDPLIRGALFAAIAGCVSLMIHGLVDFNFQIPANAIYFFALLGIGSVAGSLRDNPMVERVIAR